MTQGAIQGIPRDDIAELNGIPMALIAEVNGIISLTLPAAPTSLTAEIVTVVGNTVMEDSSNTVAEDISNLTMET